MAVARDLKKLLRTDDLSPSLDYWAALLGYFENVRKDQVTLDTMRVLCEESERCRAYWNRPRTKRVSYFKGTSDELTYLEIEEKGLEITKGDVYPRIYDFLNELELQETLTQLNTSRAEGSVAPNRQLICVAT